MKHRCYFMSVMCGLSLYSWHNYSLYEPIKNDVTTPYFLNCLVMLFYLCWDTLHMLHNPLLLRGELIVHHVFALVIYIAHISTFALLCSNMLIMECISLMNYIWRDHPRKLMLYRACCILGIRMPLVCWLWLYYHPRTLLPYLMQMPDRNALSDFAVSVFANAYGVMLIHDVWILWRLFGPKQRHLRM
jgi:hypothetical protein